jgi:putative aminopeptidase FrvX
MENIELLESLCAIPGTSGDESKVRDFVLAYSLANMDSWINKPVILHGEGFQDNLVLIFGKPRIAFYAHMDTVGFTVRYDNYVVPVGGVDAKTGDEVVFEMNGKKESARLIAETRKLPAVLDFQKPIEPGTTLTYKPDFSVEKDFIKSPYLDDRLGVWALLMMAKEAENIALVFTTWEEHGGGAAGFLARYLLEKYATRMAIIADVTWSTEGVFPGNGPVVSLRDSRIPRKVFTDKVRHVLQTAGMGFQLEVESQGGSDGMEIQHLPYPIDWCFIGPPSHDPHMSKESVHLKDAENFPKVLACLAKDL